MSNELDIISKLYESNKDILEYKACVSMVCTGGRHIEYAVSGDDNNIKPINKRILSEFETKIEEMFNKNNMHRCTINDSITIIEPLGYYDIISRNEKLWKNFPQKSNVEYTFSNLRFPLPYGKHKKSYNRNWTCSERKIIGYLQSYDHFYFSTMKPCYLCFPFMKYAYFIDENLIYFLNIRKRAITDCSDLDVESSIRIVR